MSVKHLCLSQNDCGTDGVVAVAHSLFLLLIIYSLYVSLFFPCNKINDLFWFTWLASCCQNMWFCCSVLWVLTKQIHIWIVLEFKMTLLRHTLTDACRDPLHWRLFVNSIRFHCTWGDHASSSLIDLVSKSYNPVFKCHSLSSSVAEAQQAIRASG